MTEKSLPEGADWIPDALPKELTEGDSTYIFGNQVQVGLLNVASEQVGVDAPDLFLKYMRIAALATVAEKMPSVSLIRRVGEVERVLSLDEEIDLTGMSWETPARTEEAMREIHFPTPPILRRKLIKVADEKGVTVPQLLERMLCMGLRMSYELRAREDISYYTKTSSGAARFDEFTFDPMGYNL